jgi:transposase
MPVTEAATSTTTQGQQLASSLAESVARELQSVVESYNRVLDDNAQLTDANAQLVGDNARLEEHNAKLASEVEHWKRETARLQEVLRRLKDMQQTPREHVDPNEVQLAFEQIAKELIALRPAPQKTGSDDDEPKRKGPGKPTPHGRGSLPEHLPVEVIEIVPKDLPEGATKVGEDVSWRLGFHRGGFYRLKVVRPRYAVEVQTAPDSNEVLARMVPSPDMQAASTHPMGRVEQTEAVTTSTSSSVLEGESTDAPVSSEPVTVTAKASCGVTAEVEAAAAADGVGAQQRPRPPPLDTTIVQACMPSEIIDRGLPTADLLAHIFVGKFADKLPYNRQEGIAAREGVKLGRSILCQWTAQAYELVHPLIVTMEVDARRADYILTDSTGTLVQAKTRCKKGYFWVYVSGNGHVVYRYSAKNDHSDPAAVFAGYSGIVLADATSTLDALCRDNGIERAGCSSHARRYFFKALSHDHNRALVGIGMYNRLFELEKDWKKLAPAQRLVLRQQHSRPVFDALIGWCEQQLPLVDDPSPIRSALFYTLNNRAELGRFLDHGNIPCHNNRSELELRRLVVGQGAWLFVGSDETAPWTCAFSSLVGSCSLNGLDPEAYMRDLLRVLPHWPARRLLELCPRDWPTTRARLDPDELALPLGPLTVPPPLPS